MKRLSAFLLASATALALSSCEPVTEPGAAGAPDADLSVGAPGKVDVVVVLDRDFAPGGHAANERAAADLAGQLGVNARLAYGTALFGFAASVPEGRLRALERDPRVVRVERDRRMSLPTPPTAMAPPGACSPWPDCRDGGGGGGGEVLPWGVDRVDADLNANDGAGIHVYVLDTGIDADHADLEANLGNGFAVESCRGGGCLTPWDDDHGHGTHVSGTVGAIDDDSDVVGVAPGVTLHAVKVLDRRGSGSFSGIVDGVDWVASEVQRRGAAAAANMSLGGGGSKSGTCTSSGFTGSDTFHEALCNAAHVGVVFAVAAGNDGADAAGSVPAAYDDAVITVSATSEADDWAGFSNWGDDAASWDDDAGDHAPVALAAPGVDVLSLQAGGGTTTLSGTSMASPHVAGAVALYLAGQARSADYSAFTDTRSGLLSADESTDGFSNTSGNPHQEDFLDAEGL